jgi:HSP20 family protein
MSFWTFDLIEDIERMRREMDRFLEDARPSAQLPFSRISFLPGRAARAYPLLNISEDGDGFHMHGLAPGIFPDTLDISITGNQLSIAGEKRPLPEEIQPEAIHRSERAGGRFLRTITLPSEVDSGKISANYTDGLLRISLPKAAVAKPKKIKVSMK